jgi:hypothetical protein
MGVMAAIPGRLVYRPVLGRMLAVCYAGFVAWWLIAGLAGGGNAGPSWTASVWLLALGTVVYAVLWRPAVVVDSDGVLLVNVMREVRVPWAALEAVETRYTLTLIAAGHRYASWAAGAPGRGGLLTPPGGVIPQRSSRDLRSDSGAAAFLVEQAWAGWRDRPQAQAQAQARARARVRSAGDEFLVDEPSPAGGLPPDDGIPEVGVRWNLSLVAGLLTLSALALLAAVVSV